MQLIVLSGASTPAPALEALEILGHSVEIRPFSDLPRVGDRPVIVDARVSLLQAKNTLLQLSAISDGARLVLVSASGFAAVNETWPADEFILDTAEPAEFEARIRLAMGRVAERKEPVPEPVTLREAGIEIDEGTYTVRVQGRALNLTYKEFELIKFLAASPDQVFTREHLLSEVWGMDYFGGTRTVDVHVRRLRSKLGSDHEGLIRTVRNVGYLFARRHEVEDADSA